MQMYDEDGSVNLDVFDAEVMKANERLSGYFECTDLSTLVICDTIEWCVGRDIEPEDVTDEDVDHFCMACHFAPLDRV